MWKNTYSVKIKSLLNLQPLKLGWRANSSLTQEKDITVNDICAITKVTQHHTLRNVLTRNTDALYALYLTLRQTPH